ncbi:MAG: hypothetical protein FWF81_01720 [Defluviitaleaceae bacterium]|nr:hypothetical protein [Defluviitaleaceae bacterium]
MSARKKKVDANERPACYHDPLRLLKTYRDVRWNLKISQEQHKTDFEAEYGMDKTILAPFGYEVWKQKSLPKKSRATKFQTASTYRYNHLAPKTMKVEKRIIEISPNPSEVSQ